MEARERLDELKLYWGLRTDEELAKKIGTPKTNLDVWVRRKSIPEKWELKISQMSNNASKEEHILDPQSAKLLKAWQSLPAEKKEMHFHKIMGDALEHEVMSNPIHSVRTATSSTSQKTS